MSQTERRHERLAVRLSLIISRLVAGETLDMALLATEFGVSIRTLRRDFRERLMYLDLEYRDGTCTNGLVCGQSFGEVRVPHKGNVVEKVIEGAYEVLGVFDRVEEKRDAMQSLALPEPARHALANAALKYRFGEDHQPVTVSQLLTPRRREDYSDDLWTVYQRVQENLMKGGLSGRTVQGKSSRTRAVTGIDGDVKLNRALWVMAENMLEFFGR